jgi:hypothetical protein
VLRPDRTAASLRAEEAATPAKPAPKVAPRPPSSRPPAYGPEAVAAPGSEAEDAEQPGQINALTIVPVEAAHSAVPAAGVVTSVPFHLAD